MLPEEICPEGYTTLAQHGNMNPYPETWRMFTAAESWKKTGPVEQFYDATDGASLANRIGMAEGVYYGDVIERQRRGRPANEESERRCCGGYLVWKYNDSWVSIYSAKVDYFLEPYHVYYTLRAAYAPVILSFDIDTYIYLSELIVLEVVQLDFHRSTHRLSTVVYCPQVDVGANVKG